MSLDVASNQLMLIPSRVWEVVPLDMLPGLLFIRLYASFKKLGLEISLMVPLPSLPLCSSLYSFRRSFSTLQISASLGREVFEISLRFVNEERLPSFAILLLLRRLRHRLLSFGFFGPCWLEGTSSEAVRSPIPLLCLFSPELS